MRQQPKAKEAWREPKNRKQKDKATKTTAGARELGLTQQPKPDRKADGARGAGGRGWAVSSG